MAVDGPQNTCIKSDFYDLLHPSVALVTVREKEAQGVRRREWNRAFTAKGTSRFTKLRRPTLELGLTKYSIIIS
jgi:hypothetical protein